MNAPTIVRLIIMSLCLQWGGGVARVFREQFNNVNLILFESLSMWCCFVCVLKLSND